jgi:hypothetical protein
MAAEFLLDFQRVAVVGRNSRHRPTFPVSQFEYAVDPAHRQHAVVQERKRLHHGGWFLPLLDGYVRAWLKKVRFSKEPVVVVSGVEVACGRPMPTPEEISLWVQHYDRGFFTPVALRAMLAELEEDRRHFDWDEEHEREPRLAALRQLLGNEVPPDA